jgi:hypothetical protein
MPSLMPIIMPLPTPTPACACRRPVFKNSNPVVRTKRCLPTLSPKKSGMAARDLRHLHGARHEDEVVDKKKWGHAVLLMRTNTQSRPEPNSCNLFLRAHQEHGARTLLLVSKTPSRDQSRTLAISSFRLIKNTRFQVHHQARIVTFTVMLLFVSQRRVEAEREAVANIMAMIGCASRGRLGCIGVGHANTDNERTMERLQIKYTIH